MQEFKEKTSESENLQQSEQIRAYHLLTDKYDSIYYCDIEKDECINICKDKSEEAAFEKTSAMLNQYALSVVSEDKSIIFTLAQNLRAVLEENEGKYKAAFRRYNDNGEIRYFEISITEDKNDSNKAVIAFKNIHKSGMLRRRQKEIIAGFASEYVRLFLVNLDDDSYAEYVNFENTDELNGIFEERSCFSDAMKKYLEQFVHPDDKDRMYSYLDYDFVKSILNKKRNDRILYRRNCGGEWKWFEQNIIKIEDYGDVHEIVIGFAMRDEEIQRELSQKTKLKQNLEIIEALAADYSSVYLIDIEKDKVEPYTMNSETKHKMSEVFSKSSNYTEAFESYVNHFVYEPDRKMMIDSGDKANIISRLSQSQSFSVVYRGMQNGEIVFCEMKYVKTGNKDDIKDVALGFAYKDEEIMRQYLNERLYSEYISAFMVNLREDKYRIYKQPETTFAMNRRDRIWSQAMASFASECDPEYYELIKNIGTPEFLRQELADVDRREYLYRNRFSSNPWRRAVVMVLDREDGVPCDIIVTFTEIDDYQAKIEDQKRQLELQRQQLEQALSLAQSANRAKTTFLNNMSHDIRTPMNAIIGFTELASRHIDNPEQVQDFLSKISKSSEHLLSLINDVLDMSRIESGKMQIEVNDENLSDIIHGLSSIIAADVRKKNIDFTIDISEVSDENIVCDKLRLNQVLLNILSNAVKFTPDSGKVMMKISEKASDKKDTAIFEFIIKDTGIGMSREFIKKVYDPFTRVKSSTISGIQGTGLGMTITKNIVEMMHGDIDVESEEGKGTTVTVNLEFPIKETENVNDTFRGIKTLVDIKDEEFETYISNMLGKMGMCVSLYKGEITPQYMPDVIILENASDDIEQIANISGKDIPIIAIISDSMSYKDNEGETSNIKAFLNKPVFKLDIIEALSKCVGKNISAMVHEEEMYKEIFSGKKVLLVEDNELNREIANDILIENGFEVTNAVNGLDALQKIKNATEGQFDIVLMDVQMPVMDGYEATKEIRALNTKISTIPIIAMTANAFEEDRQNAFHAGMNDHIAKPIDIKKLNDTLKKYI